MRAGRVLLLFLFQDTTGQNEMAGSAVGLSSA